MNQDYQNLYQSGKSQMNRDPNPQTLTQAAPSQPGNTLYSYCRVKRNPWLVPVAVVVTGIEGVIITLLVATTGASLWTSVFIGGFFSAMFAFIFWIAYRYQAGAAKRHNSYLAADGGQSMFSDFASAQPFANDQFRVGRQYLFIRNGAVLRLDSINDIVRVATRSGVGVSVTVNDENGSMSLLLCKVHRFNDRAEIEVIREAVMHRHLSV